MINSTIEEFGLTSFYVSKKTIRTHITQNSLSVSHPGVRSPLHEIEAVIVEMIIALRNMRQPLKAAKGLQLVNLLIKELSYEGKVIKFKIKRGWTNEGTNHGKLRMKY